MRIRSTLRRRLIRTDDGFALITVLGAAMLLGLIVALLLSQATVNIAASRRNQDVQAALAAADAGVQDYLAKLNSDQNYYTKGNTDAANKALVSSLSSSSWQPVPGPTTDSSYHYRVMGVPTAVSGIATTAPYITLRVQGHSRNVTKTTQVQLGKSSFLDYMYFTQYETIDPVANTTAGASYAACAKHFYDGRNS